MQEHTSTSIKVYIKYDDFIQLDTSDEQITDGINQVELLLKYKSISYQIYVNDILSDTVVLKHGQDYNISFHVPAFPVSFGVEKFSKVDYYNKGKDIQRFLEPIYSIEPLAKSTINFNSTYGHYKLPEDIQTKILTQSIVDIYIFCLTIPSIRKRISIFNSKSTDIIDSDNVPKNGCKNHVNKYIGLCESCNVQ